MRNLVDSEIYVLENSQKVIFYISKDVDPNLIQNIFDDDFNFKQNTEEGELCINLFDSICDHYGYNLHLEVICSGDQKEAIFMSYMVEDSINGKDNYYNYLCDLHKKVKK